MENYFTPKECLDIINLSKILKVIKTDGGYLNNGVVNYTGWQIPNIQNYKWIFDRMIGKLIMDNKNVIVNNYPTHIGLHKFNIGDKFTRHSDTNKNRIWAVGTNLNEEYTGGDFYLYEPHKLLSKKRGEIYCFNSYTEHEITEIKTGERWSLILFLCFENLAFKKTLI
jgi:hypothetical protein